MTASMLVGSWILGIGLGMNEGEEDF
jgi:hypothetical protein